MLEVSVLKKEHLPDVAKLECLCFSQPWSEYSLELLLQEPNIGFAVTEDCRVVAYGGMLCVLDEGQITNIATHPEHRRCGYASMVVRSLCAYAKDNGISDIYLEVRRSNESAIKLYTSCGFLLIGERKNFYRAPVEDAVLMKRTISE